MFKSKKGFSLITVIMAVLVMVIILSALTYTAYNSIRIRNLNRLYNNIRTLNDEVAVYYLRNESLPVTGNAMTITEGEIINSTLSCVLEGETFDGKSSLLNPNDFEYNDEGKGTATYYYLNVDAFDDVVLDYSGNYIINEQSHTIYYVDGISVGDTTYYTIPLSYADVNFNDKEIGLAVVNDLYLPAGESVAIKDAIELYTDDTKATKTTAKSYSYGKLESYTISGVDYSDYIKYDSQSGIITCVADNLSNLSADESKFTANVTIQSYGTNQMPITETVNVYLIDFAVAYTDQDEIADTITLKKGDSISFEINSYACCTTDMNKFEIESVSSNSEDTSSVINKYSDGGKNYFSFDTASLAMAGKYKIDLSYKTAHKEVYVNVLDPYVTTMITITTNDSAQSVSEDVTSKGIEFDDIVSSQYLYLNIDGLDETGLNENISVSWSVEDNEILTVSESEIGDDETGILKLIVFPKSSGNTTINYKICVDLEEFATVSVNVTVLDVEDTEAEDESEIKE